MEAFLNSDRAILFFLNEWTGASPMADRGILFLAEYLPYALVILLILLLLSRGSFRNTIRIGALALGAGLVARFGFGELIRFLYERPRPFLAYPDIHPLFAEVSPAFPSGHALFFFALATVVYRFDRGWGTLFFAAAFLMGVSRIAAGVHYPSDIFGGAILGVAVGYLSVRLCRTLFAASDEKKMPAA